MGDATPICRRRGTRVVRDGARLVYHTAAPGDPIYVTEAGETEGRLIYAAPAGTHCHYLTWSPGDEYIYFVQGSTR